jgi:glycyl-tRNA synthetase beta chain
MTKPLLIEIGVEELPAIPFLKELPNIRKKWDSVLKEYNLLSAYEFYYTPRRLVFLHSDFALKQPDCEEEFIGAPLEIAYKDGEPTNAALGFAKKCGVELNELSTTMKGNREVLYYKKSVEGQNSGALLDEMIYAFMTSLSFGKSMRWGSLSESFIRPIRWVAVLLGDEIVEVELYGVKSSNQTYPHRMVSYDPVTLTHGTYFDVIEKSGIVLDPKERESKILDEFKKIEQESGVAIELDRELLAEIVAITEYPTALLGSFDHSFLRLPPEVIIASMKEHQRYFPVYKEGKLSNQFVVVSNAKTEDFSLIIAGNERVLKPRLADALFFYDNDIKNGFDTEGLNNILFMDGLGSVADKCTREKAIALALYSRYSAQVDGSEELVARAATIAKADLLSEMVYEFTELQGLMGYYYAKEFGEDGRVALALKEQYLPDSETSELPSTPFSSIIALSQKIDTLMALFSVGKIPTGSRDPFALRRAVNGIVRIVVENGFALDIDELFDTLVAHYAPFDLTTLKEFFIERLYKFYDLNPSVIKAVLESGERDICELDKKITALGRIVARDDFSEINSTFKRVANITKDVDMSGELTIDTGLFEGDSESVLYNAFTEADQKPYVNYEERLENLFALKAILDNFFDNVMVNVEDEAIKNNRLALIATIYRSFASVADIKEITI